MLIIINSDNSYTLNNLKLNFFDNNVVYHTVDCTSANHVDILDLLRNSVKHRFWIFENFEKISYKLEHETETGREAYRDTVSRKRDLSQILNDFCKKYNMTIIVQNNNRITSSSYLVKYSDVFIEKLEPDLYVFTKDRIGHNFSSKIKSDMNVLTRLLNQDYFRINNDFSDWYCG